LLEEDSLSAEIADIINQEKDKDKFVQSLAQIFAAKNPKKIIPLIKSTLIRELNSNSGNLPINECTVFIIVY
jgi:hypothetical protein